MKLILGSTSKARNQILKEAGFQFETIPADIDEKAIRHFDARTLTATLAEAKLDVLLFRVEGPAVIVTADTVARVGNRILEKPVSAEEAREFYEIFNSEPVEVIGSISVAEVGSNTKKTLTDEARVYFTPFSESQIDAIIQEAPIYTWAGAFGTGHPLIAPHVQKVDGEMYTVRGLSLHLLEPILASFGIYANKK